jgi:predicted GIY-YIG superfamily endonuclease
MERAIVREKRIKRWPRAWKYDLIHSIIRRGAILPRISASILYR